MMKRVRARWQLYLIILLPVVYIFVFSYIPMGGVIISFKDYNFRQGIFGSPWVGLDHFVKFFSSINFKTVLVNTVAISVYSLLVGFPIPVLFALLLNALRGRRYKKLIQTVTYLPHFISTVVMVSLIFQLLDYRIGLYGNLYMLFTGETAPNIMAVGKNFRHVYVWSGVWQSTGYNSIMYFVALSGIDPSLHEAATIDGASRWQRVRYVDFPGILPTVSIMLILQVGKIMNVGYEKVLLMQNDLNIKYSEVISTYVYKVGLAAGLPDYSYSTAIGLFNSVINLTLLLAANKISKAVSNNGIF